MCIASMCVVVALGVRSGEDFETVVWYRLFCFCVFIAVVWHPFALGAKTLQGPDVMST